MYYIFLILFFCSIARSVAYEYGNLTLGSSYSGSNAASWAVSCIPGCTECPECTSSTCSCGCTYFTTHAMVHGGAPNGYEGTCSVLWNNFKGGKYPGWVSKGTNANSILPGDAVIMNNGHDGDASHCCIGTSKGLISCHNPSHANVPPSSTWYSGGYINAIWGVSSSATIVNDGKCSESGYFCGSNGLGLNPNYLYQCSDSGALPILKTTCSFTCITMPEGENDICASAGSCAGLSNGGYYCGTNKINGDPDALHLCDAAFKPQGATKCLNGCESSTTSTSSFALDSCK